MCRKKHNLFICTAVAAALGILLGRIFPTGFLVLILGVAVVGIGAILLFT